MSFREIGTSKGPGAETYLATRKGQAGQGGKYDGDWLSARPEGQLAGHSVSRKASQAGGT